MNVVLYYILLVTVVVVAVAQHQQGNNNNNLFGQQQVQLESNLNGRIIGKRGTISWKNNVDTTSSSPSLSQQTESLLTEFASTGGMHGYYGIKLADSGAESSVPLCNLVASQFRDEITLVLDQMGNVIDVDYTTPKICTKEDLVTLKLPAQASWNTTVRVKRPREAARPIEIVETPEEKEKQQQPGFFSKYWYFFVSVFIMMILNGVMSQMGGGPDPTAGAPANRRR